MIENLKNPVWHRKARSLYIITTIGLEIDEALLPELLNHPKAEVRLQTVLYYIRVYQNNPLSFLNDLEVPLTLWQQIYIEDALKHHQGEIPDFSQWLEHPQSSVVIFSIKLIADYNQYENIPKLLVFMDKENDLFKIHTLQALSVLGYDEVIDILISKFPKENNTIKKEILKFIQKAGTENHFEKLKKIADIYP
jgi:hypothetical protein